MQTTSGRFAICRNYAIGQRAALFKMLASNDQALLEPEMKTDTCEGLTNICSCMSM